MSAVAWVFAMLLLAASICVIPALVLWAFRRTRPGEWPPEGFCRNPVCGDPSYDHQTETEDGACARVGCPCKAMVW